MAKLLNIGSLNVDYVYAVPHFVAAGETLSAADRKTFPGGKGLNQTVAAARAGAKISHAGAIGEDGRFLLELLEQSGADISSTAIRQTIPSGHAIIQVNREAENAIIILSGANGSLTCEEIDKAILRMDAGDYLLLQNEVNALDYIIPKAAQKGLKILFNPAPMTAAVKDLPLELIDTLVVNEGEGRALAGDMEALKNAYPKQKILLTRGSRGAQLYADGQCYTVAAFSVEAVDTTAAGDCFMGYYAAALAEGLPYIKALTLASAASAIAVTRAGAAPSIPLREEVEAFLTNE